MWAANAEAAAVPAGGSAPSEPKPPAKDPEPSVAEPEPPPEEPDPPPEKPEPSMDEADWEMGEEAADSTDSEAPAGAEASAAVPVGEAPAGAEAPTVAEACEAERSAAESIVLHLSRLWHVYVLCEHDGPPPATAGTAVKEVLHARLRAMQWCVVPEESSTTRCGAASGAAQPATALSATLLAQLAADAADAAGRAAGGGPPAFAGVGVASTRPLARLAALEALEAPAGGPVRWLKTAAEETAAVGWRPVTALLKAGLQHHEY